MNIDIDINKLITKQSKIYNDKRFTEVLIRIFNNIVNNKEPDGCLSNSIALHVILRYLGYNPQICYGLCVSPLGFEFYHAWIELDKKIIDISIYGNSHFSPYWLDDPLNPVVLDDYDNTPLHYGNRVFDEDWDKCMIAQAIKMGTIEAYIENAPVFANMPCNGMWMLIFYYLGEPYSADKCNELRQFVSKERL